MVKNVPTKIIKLRVSEDFVATIDNFQSHKCIIEGDTPLDLSKFIRRAINFYIDNNPVVSTK